jgi:hypothetical protein
MLAPDRHFEGASVLPILAVALVICISFGVAAFGCLAMLKVILRITEMGSRGRRPVEETPAEERSAEEAG